MSIDVIRVPDVGSADPVDVIEISVKPGDEIVGEDTIVVLESDKATVEVPAPTAGKVKQLLVKVGDRVREGDPLLELDTGAAETVTAQAAPGDSAPAVPSPAEPESAVAPAVATAAGSAEQAVTVPDLGDISEAELIELTVKVGDQVAADQVIAVLESDKASMEIPAPFAGEVLALAAKPGDKLSTGSVLLRLKTSSTVAPEAAHTSASKVEATQAEKSAARPASAQPAVAHTAATQAGAAAHAGPAVRKLARELGVDVSKVPATGPKGRVLKDDVHAYVKKLLTEKGSAGTSSVVQLPEIDFSKYGPVERIELNKIRRLSASNLHRSWVTIPHVTQHDEADITELEAFRKQENARLAKDNVKLTMLAFMVKACATALREFPHFNSSLDTSGEVLVRKEYVHIGVAVDTENGLVVPVIRDADRKGIVEIAAEVGELAEKARNRKLTPQQMQGGSFSISSLGGIGGTAFTPIVNWPEVAILGVSKSQFKPVWNGKEFVPRLMVPLSLSYDHRVIDGADAARFVAFLCSTLADMRRALL